MLLTKICDFCKKVFLINPKIKMIIANKLYHSDETNVKATNLLSVLEIFLVITNNI